MLIDNLIEEGWLKSDRIIEAFRLVERADFIPSENQRFAEQNSALDIGHDQTISQPSVVAFMLEKLKPQGQVLDVGSGSGWTTVLLSYLSDYVWGIERIKELSLLAKKNASKYNRDNIEFVTADASLGYPPAGKVDRILVSASAPSVESLDNLRSQLKPGGIMVAPVNNSIFVFQDDRQEEYPGFVFVPLII